MILHVETDTQNTASHYKNLLAHIDDFVHVTVEVSQKAYVVDFPRERVIQEKSMQHHAAHHHGHIRSDIQTDPVCGMNVDPETAKHKTSYKKENYYFCAENCLKKFKADPEQYLSPQEEKIIVKGAIYTCPMAPDPAGRAGIMPYLRHGLGA